MGFKAQFQDCLWCFFLTNIESVNSVPKQEEMWKLDLLLTPTFIVDFAIQLSAEKDTDKF